MEKNILREANILFHKGDFDEAVALYKQAQQTYSDLYESLELVIEYTERLSSKSLPVKVLKQAVNKDRFGNTIREKVVIDKKDPRLVLVKPESLEDYYFDQIVESKLFDPEYYLSRYYDELTGVDNLLDNFLNEGIEQKRNPSSMFDTEFYLKHNPDVAQAEVNPFLHYVGNGRFEGREAIPKPYDSPYVVAPAEYIERLPTDEICDTKAVRAICFYLPQFHAIPENDEWWGKGFTEWTNVKPAKPQFEGHYQPHVPDDFLGYYNLLEKETQRKQIELAKQYGIEGFCYYLYWFSGQRLLEQPLDNMLADKTLDLPFCVCWANENWSRRWDGLDNDLLMVQDYSPEDDIAFIENTSKYLKDERYIKINGKPLLMIYRPNLFPDMKATAKRWRKWCRENGVGEIYLAYPQSFESVPPEEYDFDAAVEFPPNKSNPPNITEFQTPIVEDFQSTVYDWRVFVERSKSYKDVDYTLFRGLTPSWDNTARKKNKGTVFQNSCPKLFEQNAVDAFNEAKRSSNTKDEQIVFINAWNEWAEGAHLEPDQKYGYAWLQAIKNAHELINKKKNKIIIVSHDAHPHGAQILCLNMAKEFKQKLGIDVELIVLGEGVMLKKYAQYAAVHQFNLESMSAHDISERLKRVKNSSLGVAIVNTTVSGTITPYLKKEGFNVVSLIHELPNVLKDMHLEKHAELIAQNADQIVFPAHQVLHGFESFIGKKLFDTQIRPQGIYLPSILRDGQNKEHVKNEVKRELKIPLTSQIIMCAGYADHRKGFDIFVESAMAVMSRNENVYALWLGHWDKPFVTEVLTNVTDKKLRERFILPGIVDDPRRYYVAADVYALTSREDPFPSVVLEALDALTPVVAFKDSGGFENLLSRDCGLLVEKGNVSAYSNALAQIIDDVELSLSLAKQGQAIVKEELSFYHYLFDLMQFGGAFLPKVSVVIPNYNYEKYIESRLTSVFSQTYPIFEIIVLDDKSTDNSVKKIEEVLKRTNIPSKLIVNETNSGSVFKQWRRGAEVASGDLLWIAEADDLAEPTFLEKLVHQYQDSVKLADDYKDYTSDIGDYWEEDYIIEGSDEIKRALCVKNTIPNVSGAIFRRDSFKETMDKLDSELALLKVAGDWLVYLEILAKGKIAFIHESLNSHRRHTSSVTKKNNHLDEVVSIQERVSSQWPISNTMKKKIDDYRVFLENYFN